MFTYDKIKQYQNKTMDRNTKELHVILEEIRIALNNFQSENSIIYIIKSYQSPYGTLSTFS